MKIHNWKLSYCRIIYGTFHSIYGPVGASFDVFHQPRSAYLFIQRKKSIRNLNKSLLKCHRGSHSRSASHSSSLLSPFCHSSSWLHSVNGLAAPSLFHFIFCRNIPAHTLSSVHLEDKAAKHSCTLPASCRAASGPSGELGRTACYSSNLCHIEETGTSTDS